MNSSLDQEIKEPLSAQETLFKSLIEKAIVHKDKTPFEYLKSAAGLFAALQYKRGIAKIIRVFDLVATATYKKYCKQVRLGIADFSILYAYVQYLECKRFYEGELKTISSMIEEYWAYCFAGHFLEQWLLFRHREKWHLWDHREDSASDK